MPLTKLQFRPGVDTERTTYAQEGGWYAADKVRFRAGFPEKIGGWQRLPGQTPPILGICRSLHAWNTLTGASLLGVGTGQRLYVLHAGQFRDITPLRSTSTPGAVTVAAATGSVLLLVTHAAHGAVAGDSVIFSGGSGLGGAVTAGVLNREHVVDSVVSASAYRVRLTIAATAADTGNGAGLVAQYLLPAMGDSPTQISGWGAGNWGAASWGVGAVGVIPPRMWGQANYGEAHLSGIRGGALYYWEPGFTGNSRATAVHTMLGAQDVPTLQNYFLVSDTSRFVLCFGVNNIGATTLDPMLIRWSDQENFLRWTPAVTNQAGSLRLSVGSRIVAAVQARQEVLVLTDIAAYSLQYQGPPFVWGTTLLADSVSIGSSRAAVATPSGVYWMGRDSFYAYDGRVRVLPCALHRSVFHNIDWVRAEEIFGGVLAAFDEVWWWYPQTNGAPMAYVVYNYAAGIWYPGTMERTAWVDRGYFGHPVAAVGGVLVSHETGADDATTHSPVPIPAFIETAEFGMGDGDRFGLVRRILPDVTFRGSTVAAPQVRISLTPRENSGAAYTTPASVGGAPAATVTRTNTVTVEQFTGAAPLRVRGRQVTFRLASTDLGVQWQLGIPRLDVQADGKNG